MDKKWVIRDWMNNKVFDDQLFDSFEDADEFLNEFIEKKYPETKNNEKLFVETKDEYWIKEKWGE